MLTDGTAESPSILIASSSSVSSLTTRAVTPARARLLRIRHPDHAVAGHHGGKVFLAPSVGAGGTPRQHQIAQVRQTVVHPHRDVVSDAGAEFAQHLARLAHHARAVVLAAVPVG